jgi:hypothetical protein
MENNVLSQLAFGFDAAPDNDSVPIDVGNVFPVGDLAPTAKPEIVYRFVCALGNDMVISRNGLYLILPSGYEVFLATYSGLVPEENPDLVNELGRSNSRKIISSDFKLMVRPLEGRPGQLFRTYHNNFESALKVINDALDGSKVLEFEIGIAYADGLCYTVQTCFSSQEFVDSGALEKYLVSRMEYSKVKSIFSAERAEVDSLLKRYAYFNDHNKGNELRIAC